MAPYPRRFSHRAVLVGVDNKKLLNGHEAKKAPKSIVLEASKGSVLGVDAGT